jgi:hypothetical protein
MGMIDLEFTLYLIVVKEDETIWKAATSRVNSHSSFSTERFSANQSLQDAVDSNSL